MNKKITRVNILTYILITLSIFSAYYNKEEVVYLLKHTSTAAAKSHCFYWFSATQAKISGTRTVKLKNGTILTYTEMTNQPNFKSKFSDSIKVGEE